MAIGLLALAVFIVGPVAIAAVLYSLVRRNS